jgi:acyl carrier protein
MSDIEDRVKDILMSELGTSEGKLVPEADIINDLGADSISTVELMMKFEDEFDLKIPDEEAQQLRTVGQVIEYVDRKVKEKAAGA